MLVFEDCSFVLDARCEAAACRLVECLGWIAVL